MSDGNHSSGRKSNSSGGGNNRGSQRGGNSHGGGRNGGGGSKQSSGGGGGSGQRSHHHSGSGHQGSNSQPQHTPSAPVPPGDVGGSVVPSPVAAGSTPTGSPTSTYQTNMPSRDQILSGGMVHVRYYDEQQGTWGMRRPSVQSGGSTAPKSFVVCNISLGNSERGGAEVERCASLNELLSSQTPTFVAMLEMTEAFFASMQQLSMVRRYYALTDLMKFNCSIDGGIRGAEPTIVEHGCVFLIRKTVLVDFAECQPRLFEKSKERSRPFVLLHMRNFHGMSCTIGAAHFDPCATAAERCAAVTTAIGKMDMNADIVALAGNFGDHVSDVKDQELRKELSDVMRSQSMMDAFESVSESVNTAPVSFWLREGARATASMVSALTDRRWCRFGSIITIALRSGSTATASAAAAAAANPASPTGIAIPQPRSAKGAVAIATKGSPSPMVLTDPAVVVVDERLPASMASVGPLPAGSVASTPPSRGEGGINVATLLSTSIKPRLRFRKENAFHLKGGHRGLASDEVPYDLTSHFTSMHDALDAVNNGSFPWEADYFMYNNTILAADHVSQCDLKGFRRYAQSKPNPLTLISNPAPPFVASNANGVNVIRLLDEKIRREQAQTSGVGCDVHSAMIHPAGMVSGAPQPMETRVAVGVNRHFGGGHAVSVATNPPQPPSVVVSQAAIHSNGPVVRPRQWSEAWCTLLYQVTPKEMKFDISPLVGLKKGNLKEAIARLNTKKTMATALSDKPDKLLDYGYDYALLYCPERQGYWLLACSDVPCDILTCRSAAA